MCGIAGILSFKDKVTLQSLKTMTDTIVHRGPDGEGQWVNHNGQIGFGHRRLSIIDLSELGKQPMHYLYMRYTITFNGEIYNYREIKNDLIKAGYRFISETDTEVLLALYDLKKERCLENLDGMFAFAIWDESTQELFCARDRFGEKPFYYTIYNNQFIFGSEMKEIFSIGVPKTVNYNMVYNYLENDLVENPLNKQETFFENIYKLEAATYLKVKDKKIKKIKYWEINLKNRSEVSFAEAEKEFTRLFEISISRRLRSDVPVGSSLSGGLDSSSVVARINKILQNNTTQKTFSARFHNKDFDEGKFMLQIQKKFNLDSYYVYPDSNTLLKNLDLVYHHQEEPFGSASILAQWEVMRLAKQNNVSVLLDGQGADEFLSGYHKYFPTYLFELAKQDKIKYNHQLTKINDLHNVNLTPTFKNRFLMNNKVLSKYLLKGKKRLTLNSKRGLNNEFYSTYKANENPFTSFDTLNEFLKYDTSIYGLEKLLRFCDRNSMAFSIEVRLPFLYHDLVEFVFSLPSEYKIHEGWSKFILRKSSESVLPKEITWRVDKMGYQAPQEDWRKKSLEIQEQINHYNMILVENNILKENSNIDYWQKLMVGKLLE